RLGAGSLGRSVGRVMDRFLILARRHVRETSVGAVYFALLSLLAIARPDFYQRGQFWNTLVYSAPVLVAAVGMPLVIVARQIDISIGWQLWVAAIAAGILAERRYPPPLVIAAGIGAGSLSGPGDR